MKLRGYGIVNGKTGEAWSSQARGDTTRGSHAKKKVMGALGKTGEFGGAQQMGK